MTHDMDQSATFWQPAPNHISLAPNEIHVWRSSLTQPDSVFDALWPTLSADEQERARRFHFDKHRRAYIIGRGLLRRLLGWYLDLDANAVEFAYTDYNKPFLAPHIHGASNTFRFNLSHSGTCVLYAFGDGRELGVDVEYIKPDFDYLGVGEGFFSDSERAVLRSLPAADQPQGFFNCWTRKEAYIKAHGEGLSLPLDQFDVTLRPGEPAKLLATRPDPAEVAQWSLRALPMQAEHAAALAVEGSTDWELAAFDLKP